MILSIISFLLLSLSFYNAYRMFINEPTLIKKVYFSNKADYLWSLLLAIFVFTLTITTISFGLPKFLTFSWLEIFGSQGRNLISSPVVDLNKNNYLFLSLLGSTVVYVLLSLCLPYLAKIEEIIFRDCYISLKDRLVKSITFGLAHMIVGVPLFIALVLSVVGFIFSIRYYNSYLKNLKFYPEKESRDNAIDSATSLHAKYNFIVLSTGYFLTLFIRLYY